MQKCIKQERILGLVMMFFGLSVALPASAFSFYGPGSGINYTGFVHTEDGVGFSWPWTFIDAPRAQTSFASFHREPYIAPSIITSPFIPARYQPSYQPYGFHFNYPSSPQISPLNRAPVFVPIAPQTVRAGETIQFTVQAYDADSPYLYYSAVDVPDGASFSDYTHSFFWAPTALQMGRYTVKFRVSDANAPFVEMSMSITVTDQNGFLPYTACGAGPGPYLFNFKPSLQVNAGELYAYAITGASGNNNPITYRVIDGPVGLTIDEKTGYMKWLVAFNQSGATYPVRIAAYNGQCEMSYNFTITVR